ncbi:MAG: DNA topoisomerase VI subunit B [Candidatus Micrarchaeaceae archaeon]
MDQIQAEEIFKEFKEHSISEFFKKNRQMLGYSSPVRSLVTVVHEYVTNSLDACEEAGILPEITIKISKISENTYSVGVRDNGPGIPKQFVGKALATILAGTKFHRYMQQRGQQGIGAAGCTLFSQITTGKPVYVESYTGKGKAYTCMVSIDTLHNKPIVNEINEFEPENETGHGLYIEAKFGDVKYENSDHGVYEYLKRTALSNPHAQIKIIDPDGKETVFVRSVESVPRRPRPMKPHPLGLSTNDLLDFAHATKSRKISSFFVETFMRTSQNKVNELKAIAKGVDFEKDPREMTWGEAEELVKAIKSVSWIAPDTSYIIAIGKEQIEKALKNILSPDFMSVIERKPRVFRGGVPFMVETAVAFGGGAGKKTEEGYEGNILRFANKVPLLFDSGSCAITEAVKELDWRRYKIDIDSQPISVLVNVSSIYIPYSGVGKEAIAQEDEIIDEIKLGVMEAARGVQRYISEKISANIDKNKYRTIMRYANQLAKDLSGLTGIEEAKIKSDLEKLVIKHYPGALKSKGEAEDSANGTGSEESAENKDGT